MDMESPVPKGSIDRGRGRRTRWFFGRPARLRVAAGRDDLVENVAELTGADGVLAATAGHVRPGALSLDRRQQAAVDVREADRVVDLAVQQLAIVSRIGPRIDGLGCYDGGRAHHQKR